MRKRFVIYNGVILTQADNKVCDSMVVNGDRIVAVGNKLEKDDEFKSWNHFDLNGLTVTPGFIDAHTHFYYYASTLSGAKLDGLSSLDDCLKQIQVSAHGLGRDDWILGVGYSPDAFKIRQEPDRQMLDKISGGRPAFIFSKDNHTAWVNSRALEIAGITAKTKEPAGGEIVRLSDGSPSGMLREYSAYGPVWDVVSKPHERTFGKLFRLAQNIAWKKGVTGIHSFDGPEGYKYFSKLAMKGTLGLRVNYYPGAKLLPELEKAGVRYGDGNEMLRIAGVKLFADGALGSQTALCYNKYIGSKNNCGIEVLSTSEMTRIAKRAAKLKLPCAVHAIGDKAIANVLDALENSTALPNGVRHRIEHLQMMRRKDITRIKKNNIIASMQPSHCPSDIKMVREYWGKRGAQAYMFRSLIDAGIDLVFGSDVPIEPLDPIAGIAAAVRRAKPKSKDVFYPKERITASEALSCFTAGPAIASGQQALLGYLLPGYLADFVILNQDITTVTANRIEDTEVLATFIGGSAKYLRPELNF